ncbi:hypothetical protein AALP_AA4G071500 [Arabis alpina]|uniref:Fe2OG dioxygenase domain-containing protein n=1 Tax=Arabis alpina TaxID=50452 RepID=A0A087H1P9_ARAAL|nr:hypothetical protein AALP_AA4G071500 [Arabis alpina]
MYKDTFLRQSEHESGREAFDASLEKHKEERKHIRALSVTRKKNFVCLEKVNGNTVNILEGLELHTRVFNATEQKKIVDQVCELQEKAQKGELKHVFTARGKGRSAITFGCCHRNSKFGDPARILRDETMDPLPSIFKMIITSQCNILFGSNLKVDETGEYSGGSYSLPLSTGSVLVLNGNGADLAKHCVPEVPKKRISITFRKLNESKRPVWFKPDPDLIELASVFSDHISSLEHEVSPDFVVDMTLEDELDEEAFDSSLEKHKFSKEQREHIRAMNVKRKRDFVYLEKVNGEIVNILEGLELHTDVFNAAEQKRIVDKVCELQEMARQGELKRAFTPQGKGRSAIQFGCCFNYRTSKSGNPAGILRHETVDPLPHFCKLIITRLVKWHVLPPTCVPDCCVVNIYDEGDCIPPHVDNHDFLRPFCTVSFLNECNILLGSNLKVEETGEYSGGSYSLPLPVGSVLVLNGNGANVAKHCVPEVPTKRISITFRKMNESKRPVWFTPEPDLQGIQPLPYELKPSVIDNVY